MKTQSMTMINLSPCIKDFRTGGIGEGDGVPPPAENLLMPL